MYRNILGMTEAQWNDAVTNAGRHVLTKAVFNGDTTLYGDGTDGAVVSIKFDEQMENSNGLSMGGTIASQCKVEIRQPSTPISLVNSTFVPYVGLKDSADREGYVPLGEFFATSADSNSNGGVVSVVGYDRFCKLEVPYEPTVSFPTTTTAIMADLAANRFTFSGTITDRPINEFRVGTVKDWIGWLAGLEGKNARFNRDGQLEFVYYDITRYDYTVDRENQYMAGVNTKTADNVTINAITSGTEENPIVSGNGRSITFSNPYMTQEILDDIRNTEIVDSLTEVSGKLLTVDAIEAPAKSVEMNIKPYQNLNGYDHPWVGGAGKNLLPITISSRTTNGITLTVNANGSVTVNGTATALTNFILTSSLALPDGTYVINGCPSGGGANSYRLDVNDGSIGQDTGGSATFNVSGGTGIRNVRLRIASGYTVNNLVFWPMIRIAGLSNTFEPYENICPIYPANGKNLYSIKIGRDDFANNNSATHSSDSDVLTVNTAGTQSSGVYATPTSVMRTLFGSLVGTYTYSWYAKASRTTSVRFGITGKGEKTFAVTTEWQRYSLTAEFNNNGAIYGFIVYKKTNDSVPETIEVKDFQLERGALSEYVPYNAIGITRIGKNFFEVEERINNQTNTSGTSTTGYTLSNNAVTISKDVSYYGRVFFSAQYLPAGTYTLSFKTSASGSRRVAISVRKMVSPRTDLVALTILPAGSASVSFTVSEATNVAVSIQPETSATGTITITDIQIEVGSSATQYEPYTAEHYYPISDTPIYGGTLDVTTGMLTVTHICHRFTGGVVLYGNYGQDNAPLYYVGIPNSSTIPIKKASNKNDGKLVSNYFAFTTGTGDLNMGDGETRTNVATTPSRYYFRWDSAKSASAINTLFSTNPLEIVAELQTPLVYQLTPTQVELLKGTNNIWADGDSTLNIIYLATPRANMSFRPMELQWRGNPCVQCGDRIFVETETNSLTALVMAHTLSIEGGMDDVIKCFGSSDAEVALDKSPMEKKISAAYNALQSAIQDATALLNGTRGGIFEITKENDINTGWLIKESASPNYMGNVIVANYNGIGFSTDGGATYGTAITTDGHINGQYITAHSVDVEALSVGNTSDPFSNYVYIGRRRPNDDNTDMVIRIGVASQSMVQEMRGNRTSIYKAEDVQAYVNGSLTDAELDARALMYYSDTDYVLLNLGSFRIGGMLMQAQANGGVKFIKAE